MRCLFETDKLELPKAIQMCQKVQHQQTWNHGLERKRSLTAEKSRGGKKCARKCVSYMYLEVRVTSTWSRENGQCQRLWRS